MAVKKPIVLNSTTGIMEQLQAGDSIFEANFLSAVNANASPIVIGAPVYISAAGSVDNARANSIATARVMGLVADTTISAAVSGNIMADGVLTATTTQWDAVTGGSGGLTAGAVYYLSEATAGRLRTTVPSSGFMVKIGYALNTTQMVVEIEQPIGI